MNCRADVAPPLVVVPVSRFKKKIICVMLRVDDYVIGNKNIHAAI